MHSSLFAFISDRDVLWGTHHAYDTYLGGLNYLSTDSGFSTAKTAALLKSLSADGSSTSDLVDGSDLIELGFFDLDSSADGTSSSINPNSTASDPFQGVWTPLSSITKIGQDLNTAGDVSDGEFYFKTHFEYDTGVDEEDRATHNSGAAITIGTQISWDILDGNTLSSSKDFSTETNNLVNDRIDAIYNESVTNSNPVLLGIRFYDSGSKTNGTTKYNTIMNPNNWTISFADGTSNPRLDLLSWNGSSMEVDSSLIFEFDNTDANTANIAKVGTGDNQVTSNDFVTTITYDGSTALSANTASHILSGLQDDPDAGSIVQLPLVVTTL